MKNKCSFPPITLENPIVVTDFKGDILYCNIRVPLTAYLRCPPSNREVVWWL